MKQQKNIFQKASQAVSQILNTNSINNDIIVFSHLRWDFVFQRPQHIVTRLAKNRKVIFVEEPIPFDKKDYGKARILHPHNNITVIQPKISPEDMVNKLPTL